MRPAIGERHRLGYGLAIMFSGAAFYSFLGSSKLILDEIYDRPSWFVPFFSATSLFMGTVVFGITKVIPVVGARKVARWAVGGALLFSAAMLAAALLDSGVPAVWWWMILLSLANTGIVIMFPTGGALLARVIDGAITPMAVGYGICVSIALMLVLWAQESRQPDSQVGA